MSSSPPTKYAVALFDGFQSLDVFGPIDALNYLSKTTALELSILGPTLEPVSTLHKPTPGRIGQKVVPTHTYADAPEGIEVLLVPGGQGTRDAAHTQVVVDFIKDRYPKLRYLLTVCTGSALAARAAVLDGREATSNKLSFGWVRCLTLTYLGIHGAGKKRTGELTSETTGRKPWQQRQVAQRGTLDDGWQCVDVFGHLSRDRHDLRLHR